MKALSVRQPWAWLIVAAEGYPNPKRVENRMWATEYTGPLLIHAAKTLDMYGARQVVAQRPDLERIADEKTWTEETGLLGGILGIVNLVRVTVPRTHEWYDPKFRYGWVLSDPFPIPFAPMPGLPGLFDVDETGLPETTRTQIDLWLAKQQGRH